MKKRCKWVGSDHAMILYHDREWGVPVFSDRKIFEFLVLESAQAGLSWRTILHRREGYRKAFANFDPREVSKFSQKDIKRLLKDSGIIRNRLKIESTISNAEKFLEVKKEYKSFAKYMWSFVGGRPLDGKRKKMSDLPSVTKESESLAEDLKKRGFKFFGPTIIYAHMQAVGMVNDHAVECFRYREIKVL